MECSAKDKNLKGCSCPYVKCVRHGKCCECVSHHRSHKDEVPSCFFASDAQKVYKMLPNGGLKRVK